LAEQYPDYIITHFKNFKARARTNDAGNMTSLAQTLSEEVMTNLSHWISSLYYLFQLHMQSRLRPAFF
jgi:cytochrome c553